MGPNNILWPNNFSPPPKMLVYVKAFGTQSNRVGEREKNLEKSSAGHNNGGQ